MKIQTERRNVQTEGLEGKEQAFTIRASAKAFAVLSSNIYSDKIAAVIREISANAYDAHVMVGNEKTPFEVHLPTTLEPFFYVKDFGPGLSESQIMSLYTQYFNSTKEDDDSQTGCLGIGSKSPFAYTDQFTVESRFGGEKKTYIAFLDDMGMPGIRLINTEPCAEPTGLTVHLAVQAADFSEFEGKAKRILRVFKTIPDVPGFTVEPVKYALESGVWSLRTSSGGYNDYTDPRVIQGNIAYPIKLDNLPMFKNMSYTEQQIYKYAMVDFFVDLGRCNIAASREDLHYDKNTIATLETLLRNFRIDLIKEMQKKIDTEARSWWHAMQMLHTTDRDKKISSTFAINRPVQQWLVTQASTLNFKGLPLTDKAVELTAKSANGIRYGEPGRNSQFRMVYTRPTEKIHIKDRVFIAINDLEKRVSVTALFDNYFSLNKDNISYCGVYIFDKTEEQLVINTLGISKEEILYMSKLPPVPKAEKIKSLKKYAPGLEKTETTITLRRVQFDHQNHLVPISQTRGSVPLSEVKYYLPVNGVSLVTPAEFPVNINDILPRIKPSGFLTKFGTIFLVNKEEAAALDKVGVATNLLTVFKTELDSFLKTNETLIQCVGSYHHINSQKNYPRDFDGIVQNLADARGMGEMNKLAKKLRDTMLAHKCFPYLDDEVSNMDVDYLLWLKARFDKTDFSRNNASSWPVLSELTTFTSYFQTNYPKLFEYINLMPSADWKQGGPAWGVFTYFFKLEQQSKGA